MELSSIKPVKKRQDLRFRKSCGATYLNGYSCEYLSIHQCFYFVGFNWNVAHQVKWCSRFLYHHVVFQPNSQTFFRNVNSWFTGKNHSSFDWFVPKSYIVCVESQEKLEWFLPVNQEFTFR